MFTNLKLKNKFILAFSFVLILIATIIIASVVLQNEISKSYSNILSGPIAAEIGLLRIANHVETHRRIGNSIARSGGEPDVLNNMAEQLTQVEANILIVLEELREIVRNDGTLDDAGKEQGFGLVEALSAALFNDNFPLVWELESQIRIGDQVRVNEIIEKLTPISQNINEIISLSMGMAEGVVRSSVTNIEKTKNMTIYLFMVGAAISFIFILITALRLSSSITRPINEIETKVRSLADGDFNVSFKTNRGDELGNLSNYMQELTDAIKNITSETITLANEFNINGDIEYCIDESKFKGEYLRMVKRINLLVISFVDDVFALVGVLKEINAGNFNEKLKRLPGKKEILNKIIDELVANLENISGNVVSLANNAARGDLSVSENVNKYKGEWAIMLKSMNNLMSAVSEPLKDIERNVEIMSHGDFSHLQGEYLGVFGNLQKSCNLANDIAQSYVDEITRILSSIAEGDLTVKSKLKFVGSYAPIETAMLTIFNNLNSMISEAQNVAEQVVLGAEQISLNAATLADGATKQTAAIEKLSDSVAIIYEKAVKSNSNAALANENTERAKNRLTTGDEAVKDMTNIMNKIKESSVSISKINDAITSIAFQTNLLALNASVEAARAGEHGKGFSVVADEVRNLAGKSQNSSSETQTIIENDLKSVEDALKAVNNVVNSFGTISDNIGEISVLISEIASISSEQLESISEVNGSASKITSVIKDTSTTAEESAMASRELSSKAETLRQKIAFFKLRENYL